MKKRLAQPQTMVRWMFQDGKNLLTLAVHWQPATSTYVVSVVPNGMEDAAINEALESSVAALRRHAAIAAALRAHGWTVVAYSDARATQRPGSVAA